MSQIVRVVRGETVEWLADMIEALPKKVEEDEPDYGTPSIVAFSVIRVHNNLYKAIVLLEQRGGRLI